MNTVELSERFGKMWKDMRTEAGYSHTQVAKAIGVSRTTIENWENGTSSPSQKQGFMDVLNEHFEAIKALRPKEYAAVLKRLKTRVWSKSRPFYFVQLMCSYLGKVVFYR